MIGIVPETLLRRWETRINAHCVHCPCVVNEPCGAFPAILGQGQLSKEWNEVNCALAQTPNISMHLVNRKYKLEIFS